MNRQRIHVNGFDISYSEGGIGHLETLVFAHGLGGNIDQWTRQLTYFEDRYHVLTFSMQGHGLSSKTEKAEDYQLASYGQTAIDLLEALNISSCTWIGNSMGGVVGYEVFKYKSSLVKHLITNGTTPELIYGKVPLKMIELADRALIGLIGFEPYLEIAVKATMKDPKKRQALKDMFMQTGPMAIIQSHQCLGDYSYMKLIEAGHLHVTMIRTPGDKDINKALNQRMDKLKSWPNVAIEVMNAGGHVVNMELPEDYNRMVEKILRKEDRYAH